MDPDFLLTAGLVIGALSIPAVFSAMSERRPPRFPALGLLVSLGLIVYANAIRPGGYGLDEVPDAFFGAIGSILP